MEGSTERGTRVSNLALLFILLLITVDNDYKTLRQSSDYYRQFFTVGVNIQITYQIRDHSSLVGETSETICCNESYNFPRSVAVAT